MAGAASQVKSSRAGGPFFLFFRGRGRRGESRVESRVEGARLAAGDACFLPPLFFLFPGLWLSSLYFFFCIFHQGAGMMCFFLSFFLREGERKEGRAVCLLLCPRASGGLSFFLVVGRSSFRCQSQEPEAAKGSTRRRVRIGVRIPDFCVFGGRRRTCRRLGGLRGWPIRRGIVRGGSRRRRRRRRRSYDNVRSQRVRCSVGRGRGRAGR
mmetsp:Transcript_29818/g.96197  ORF Transcript_29818/g.96197 Transcript_29818/m.96197 type:complete len:210 (+) Transcript_29818:195-824(+)